jgi:SAM-dependent methyltransferase
VTSIGDRYKDGSLGAHLYRWLRLEAGGLRDLAALFPREGLIVDLACGPGLLAHVLVEGHPGRRVIAVDHDEGRVASLAASAAGLPIQALQGDMTRYEIPACDGVALVDVLHYLDGPAQEDLLARAAAALGPGGVLVLRDPDPDGGLRFQLARLHERVATGLGLTRATLGRYRPAGAWETLLRVHGLRVEVWPLRPLSPWADRTVVGRRP